MASDLLITMGWNGNAAHAPSNGNRGLELLGVLRATATDLNEPAQNFFCCCRNFYLSEDGSWRCFPYRLIRPFLYRLSLELSLPYYTYSRVDMRWSAVLVLPFLPLSVLAGKFHESPLRSRHAGHARSIQARNNTGAPTFTLTDLYQGQSFLKYVRNLFESHLLGQTTNYYQRLGFLFR